MLPHRRLARVEVTAPFEKRHYRRFRGLRSVTQAISPGFSGRTASFAFTALSSSSRLAWSWPATPRPVGSRPDGKTLLEPLDLLVAPLCWPFAIWPAVRGRNVDRTVFRGHPFLDIERRIKDGLQRVIVGLWNRIELVDYDSGHSRSSDRTSPTS